MRILVTEGPDAVRRLIATGAHFDTDAGTARSQLTREGGHHRRRIAHAGGDATGAEISRALVEAVRDAGIAHRRERARAGPAHGRRGPHRRRHPARHGRGPARRRRRRARARRGPRHRRHGPGLLRDHQPAGLHRRRRRARAARRAPRSATWSSSSSTRRCCSSARTPRASSRWSPRRCAARAPTWSTPTASASCSGSTSWPSWRPATSSPRASCGRMREQGAEHMYLDARHFGAEMWEHRFPTILAACRAHGIDPVTEPVPVAPAAHYASGGVRTDLRGRTTVPGLYACGEVGLHRRARRQPAGLQLPAGGPGLRRADRRPTSPASAATPPPRAAARRAAPGRPAHPPRSPAEAARRDPAHHDRAAPGVLRSAALPAPRPPAARAAARPTPCDALDENGKTAEPGVETWETTNLLCVARVLVAAALRREETRGCHWREDHPDRDDADWRRHLVVTGSTAPATAPAGPVSPHRRPQTSRRSARDAVAPSPRSSDREHARPSPSSRSAAAPRRHPAAAAAATAAAAARRRGGRLRSTWSAASTPRSPELLADAGLDPVQVEDIAHLAIEEDLDHGVDVTTVATVPEDAVATGDFTAREAGTVAGLRVAEAVLSVVCTDEFEVERHVEDGDRVEAGQKLLTVTHPHPRPAHRRAQRAEPAVPPLRHRDRHPRLGGRAGGHQGARCATPARRRRGCAPWRSTRCAAAAASTTGCRCRTRRSSRTTTWSPRAASPQAFEAVRAEFPDVPIEVEVDTPATSSARSSTRAPT